MPITFNIRNNNSPAPQAPAAPGTVDLFLKVKDGSPALLGVNSRGKVARLLAFTPDGLLHIRPGNEFFEEIQTDDGYWISVDDDINDDVETAATSSPVDYTELQNAVNALAQAVARLQGN